MKKLMDKTGKSSQQIMKEALFERGDEWHEPIYSSADADLIISELRKFGNGINEIAKEINEGKITSGWSARLAPFLVAIKLLRMKINGIIPLDSRSVILPTFEAK